MVAFSFIGLTSIMMMALSPGPRQLEKSSISTIEKPYTIHAKDNKTNHKNNISPNENDNDNNNDISSSLSLREAIVADRTRRVWGVWAGSGVWMTGEGLGWANDILEPSQVIGSMTIVALGIIGYILSQLEEHQMPLDQNHFVVGTSLIPNAGQGLFCQRNIRKGTYFFSYDGERLTEEEYFQRYPKGDGRYVASLPSPPWSFEEPVYVDSMHTPKELGRWMNSLDDDNSNVVGRKSFLGQRNLYFYAARDISAGEELCWNYGSSYWDAAAALQEQQEIQT